MLLDAQQPNVACPVESSSAPDWERSAEYTSRFPRCSLAARRIVTVTTNSTNIPLAQAPSAPADTQRASSSTLAAPSHSLTAFVSASPVLEKVERVIKLIRPAVQADGGDIELLGLTPDGDVHIRLHGACVGCPSSSITLQVGIERNLRAHIPEVRRVVAN
jgi:Fe-S cluster biogenesis protein NfuA